MGLNLFDETTALLARLEAEGVAYAVAGGVALAIHGVARATADIDLLVPAAAVPGALDVARAQGFQFAALPMRFSDGMEVQRITKLAGEESLTLDLLVAEGNLEVIFQGRERIRTPRGPVWVVSRLGLIQMKTWAGRPQDLADIRRLQELDR